jgi:hypothetical protein
LKLTRNSSSTEHCLYFHLVEDSLSPCSFKHIRSKAIFIDRKDHFGCWLEPVWRGEEGKLGAQLEDYGRVQGLG